VAAAKPGAAPVNQSSKANHHDPENEVRCVIQYREHLGHLLYYALKILPTVKFDKHNPQQLAIICIYATIISVGELLAQFAR
jgi:hypothetical protein